MTDILKTYVEFTNLTLSKLPTLEENNLHMVLGMLTEVGELADTFKKKMAYGKEIDWVNIVEELGDLMFYIAGFANFNNLNLEQVIDLNIQKLMARYPNRFDADKALNRDLEAERKILEG